MPISAGLPINAYRSVMSTHFRALLQYRAAALAGAVTQLAFGLVHTMIFEAFYRSSTAPQPIAYADVVTYVWLGQALLGMLPWTVDVGIWNMVRSGTVAYELLRPLSLYTFWYARSLADKTGPPLLRALPIALIAGLFLGLQPPPSWASAGAWMAATLGALLLGCAIFTLMNISLFWTLSGEGLSRIAPTVVIVFSGMLVPLPLLPDWAQPILNALPFRGLVDVPFRLYLGHISPGEILPLLAHQLAWAVAFIVLGRRLLARGLRRLVIQGG